MFFHSFIAAGTFIAVKGAVGQIAPLVFLFYRVLIASSIFLLVIWIKKRFPSFDKKEFLMIIFLAVLAYPLNQGLFLIGISYTLPTHAALIYATSPVWIYLFSVFRKEEKASKSKLFGILLALVGVILFFAEKGITLKIDYLIGNAIVLLAVWAWAIYSVLGRGLVQKYGAIPITGVAAVVGAIIYFPFGLYFAVNFDYSHAGIVGWGGIFYAAVITSFVAYTIWYWAIRRFSPSRVAVFMSIQPIIAGVLAYFIFDERLSFLTIISGAIVLSGIYIAQKK